MEREGAEKLENSWDYTQHVHVTVEQQEGEEKANWNKSQRILIEYIPSLYPTYTKFPFKL